MLLKFSNGLFNFLSKLSTHGSFDIIFLLQFEKTRKYLRHFMLGGYKKSVQPLLLECEYK